MSKPPPPPKKSKAPPEVPSSTGNGQSAEAKANPPGKTPVKPRTEINIPRMLEDAAERKQRRLIEAQMKSLPDPMDAVDLLDSDLPKPPELVHGVLHQGSKMVIGGGSKSFKTWVLIDLAVSVATGISWWGFDTTQGRVLYMNFEIQDAFFNDRLHSVIEAKQCELVEGQLSYWGLRGKAADLRLMMPALIEKVRSGNYALIIFDPIYKGLGNRDENKAGDIASLLNEIENLAVETGAAVAFGHHFSKGNQAGKDSIDRIGGSGVFARDPDSILTMTKHEEDESFTVDAVLRNFAPIPAFVVSRNHPLMVRDNSLDPAALKRPGATQTYSDDQILAPLREGKPLQKQDWFTAVHQATGISNNGFKARVTLLAANGVVVQLGDKRTDPWGLAA